MAKLTKVHTARQLGISRTTLYTLIDQGKVSATADGLIDETELVRAAPYVDTLREHARTRVDTMDSAAMDTHPECHGHEDRVHEHAHERVRTCGHEQPWTGVDTLVDILREQLQGAQERERAYEERERVMQDHIAQLTAMLHESQQQNQRLLDMPRPAPQEAPQDALGATPARRRPPRVPTARGTAPGAASGPERGPEGRDAPAYCGPAPGAS
jgi:hypothetical protein